MWEPDMRADFEELDHTADASIRASGNTPARLFRNAARGMMSLMTGPIEGATATDEHQITLAANSLDALLRDWLSELIFLVAVDRLVPLEFHIDRIEEIGGEEEFDSSARHRLLARVGITPLNDAIARNATEIKAVTWHGLRVWNDTDGYFAEVVFDT